MSSRASSGTGRPDATRHARPAAHRSWLAVRWRQLRNPPPPVLRAVLANLVVAATGAVVLVLHDLALRRGVAFPWGDQRMVAAAVFVAAVVVAGSVLTYLWVALPTGAAGTRRRSGWAAVLGLFTSVPIAYLALVVAFELVAPMLA